MPRVQVTPTVKIALYGLRLYLILLLTLIGIKFYRDFSKTARTNGQPAVPAAMASPRK